MDREQVLDIIAKIIIERNDHLELCIDTKMAQQMEIPDLLKNIKESSLAYRYIKENLR